MRKFNFILLLLVAGFLIGNAQMKHYKWQVGVSAFAVDHTSVRGVGDGFFDFDDFSAVPFPAKLTIVRGLNRSFDVDVSANLGEVDNKRLNVNDEFMINATVGLRYRFTNGYILKQTSWFDPYLRLGAGYHKLDYQGLEFNNITDLQGHPIDNGAIAETEHFAVAGGLGINFWFSERFGANVMSEYYHIPNIKGDNIDFIQHSAGLVFRFGLLDRDGDGILDREDECPDTPGLPEFNGCPDTDQDGLPDHKDDCPETPGPIENIGCPWPDRDGDTVLDKDDDCPDTPGLVELKGCPEPEPEPIEVVEPEPVEPEPVEPPRKIVFKDVLFDFDSFVIKDGQEKDIKEVAEEIKANNNYYIIEGHTDNVGTGNYNVVLSMKRAEAVKKALVAEGVPAERLQTIGKGETEPICKTDNSAACRAQNRRVEIIPLTGNEVE